MKRQRHWTLIVVGQLGQRSRQVRISWLLPLGVVAFFLSSALFALYAGKTARAWVGDEIATRVIAVPSEVRAFSARLERELWRAPFSRAAPSPVAPIEPQVLASALLPRTLSRATPSLRLYDVNSRTRLEVRPFDALGRPEPHAFDALRDFMRCRRTGHKMRMSPKLIALLTRISARLGGPELHVISAHRAVDNVVTSPRSQHARGTAADIRVVGLAPKALQRTAFEEGAHGIGLYPKDRFVHVDVRETPYYWRESSAGENERVVLR